MTIVRSPFPLVLLICINLVVLPSSAQQKTTLFKLLPPQQTGIQFSNQLFESDTLNILTQANIYNGAGVGIGDFNNDGLMDIYFAGNMVSNKLYLNKGNLRFVDVTNAAAVTGEGRWCTGVAVVDINADGWADIYVSASLSTNRDKRINLFYINQGLNKDGIPIFKEMATAYGLADDGFSTQAYFFDYDMDGDLDMYLVTNQLYDKKTPIRFRRKLTDGSAANTDRLYRNNGNNTFTNVSKQAGITIEGWGHAACITDINHDGWPDVYVANDFVANDLCYINNKNGTFTNRQAEYFKHSGWSAMGTDAVDINNDGFVDMVSLEMLPEDNQRKKRMLSGNEYYNYTNSALFGYQHQYVRNVLQVNSGVAANKENVFSDIGFMAGVYQTDWSWCPLVADFDNDGLRDLIITNGLPRDVTDLDYIDYNNGQNAQANLSLAMTDSLPVVKLPNYAYKNVDGLSFTNTTSSWGFDTLTFSNGAAYADLDNDGDLDVVINNINGVAFVYENTFNSAGKKVGNYLSVKIVGSATNPNGIGCHLTLRYDNSKQLYYEHQPTRGYLSTDDPRAYFGLGNSSAIDTLLVEWPDGMQQIITNITASQLLTVDYKNARRSNVQPAQLAPPIFTNNAAAFGVSFKHKEKDFVDYNIQRTLPHKLSQYGPGIAVGDIDSNGYDDFYIGGPAGTAGLFYMQDANGRFTADSSRFVEKDDLEYEDMGVLLFDVDNDNDLDLYLVSGSYEIAAGRPAANNRLFMNDGKGIFTKSAAALPQDFTNGSCVRAADFDGDGDLDLFVGGRVTSGAYPITPSSFVYRNDGGKFTDVTSAVCPQIRYAGMVTDALWTDFDNDGKVDLVLAGEWMPVTFYKNNGTTLQQITSGLEQYTGWWNSLTAGDFDNDGDIDYIAGNLGLNSNYKATLQEPMWLMAKDVDNNGSLDAMVFCFLKSNDGSRKLYPMSTRDDLVSQVITMRKKFPSYRIYGSATMNDVWTAANNKDAVALKATEMRSMYIENKGSGNFEMRPLPMQAQAAPVYGMLSNDVDGDGNLDVVMVGNDYGMDPFSGRHDAFNGLVLQGDGKGNFNSMPLFKSGFFAPGDAKGLASIYTAKNEDAFIVTQNQDSLLMFTKSPVSQVKGQKWISVQPGDLSAEIVYKNGTKRKAEFYYGSTYLSQSSRRLAIDKDAVSITITTFGGTKRKVL